MTRIVVVGSANMDLVGIAARLPRPGETVLGDDFVMGPGGKGANQAIAAARAGASCTFLGRDRLRRVRRDAQGAADRVRRRRRPRYGSATARPGWPSIMVDRAGENSIIVSPGANSTFTGLSAGARPR